MLGSHVQAKAIGGISDGKGKGKGKDKGKDLGKEVGVCHAFSEKKGCKYGDKCRFSHDRATARKQGRCLACGQEGHYRPDCPIVVPESRQVQDPTSPRSSGPPPKSVPPVPTGPPNPKTKAIPQAKRVIEECGSGTSTSAQAQEALMAEAAKILKDVTLKPLRVEGDSLGALGLNQGWVMSAIATASDPQFALVDSGATNALRPAREEELKEARVIKVDLASGVTELHINRHGTLLSSVPCQVIIPAGYLVRLGFSIAWKKRGCVIRRRGRARLEVKVVKGCPLIPRDEGLQLLYEYEGLMETGSLPVLKLMSSERTPSFTAENSRQWLADKVAGGCLTRQDQLDWLSVMFPEAPSRVRHRAAGLDVGDASWSFEGVPWNRRVRRSVLKAKPGEVLLHLFSGQQRWKGPGRIIEVEKSKGADLLDEGVFQHLLGWSLRGVVGAVVGGPPCRTVSPCRAEGDGGPPPVRGRLQGRWGLEGLSGSHAELVESDSVLWLRFILAYVVAQAAADSVDSVRREAPELEVPGDICDPLELAKWALRQAAARRKEPPSVESRTKRVVMLVWEHPADPEFYMGSGRRPEWGWPSWWVFPEWQQIAQLYGVLQARFDQGKFQHERPKPTQVATTSWFLYESLDQQFLTREERALFGVGPQTTSDRIRVSGTWAKWAPGLTSRVFEAWCRWGQEQGLWPEIGQRRVLLAKLTEEAMRRRHEAQDHVPYRKGCPICVAAQGRQTSHRRAAVVGVYAASFDIAGPFISGRSFDPVSSGRDRGLGYKYFLACAFTIPLQPIPPEEKPDAEIPAGDAVALVGAEAPDEPCPAVEPVLEDEISVEAVRVRVRGKRPEDPEDDMNLEGLFGEELRLPRFLRPRSRP